MTGDPRCQLCNGAGGSRIAGRWVKCDCIRPTPDRREAQRIINRAGAQYPRRTLRDLIDAHNANKRTQGVEQPPDALF